MFRPPSILPFLYQASFSNFFPCFVFLSFFFSPSNPRALLFCVSIRAFIGRWVEYSTSIVEVRSDISTRR